MRLLTSELHVDENADANTHTKPDMLRTTLETASALTPRCSTHSKKMNQTDTERKFCIIVQTDIERMLPSLLQLKSILRLSPYFSQSVLRMV